MKKISILFSLIFFTTISYALELNNHKVNFQALSNFNMSAKTKDMAILIHSKSPLTIEDTKEIQNCGVSSIQYAGDLCYYLYSNTNINIEKLPKKIDSFSNINSKYKLSNELQKDLNFYKNQLFELNCLFLESISKEKLKTYLKINNLDIKIKHIDYSLRSATLLISVSQLNILKNLPLIQYIQLYKNNILSTYKTPTLHNNSLDKYSDNLSRKDIKIGMVDGGKIKTTHFAFQDLNNKIVQNISNNTINSHATFIAGLLTKTGAKLYNYDVKDNSFSTILKKMKKEGIFLSNHSYTYKNETKLGIYDFEASAQDRVIYANPYIKAFVASGNRDSGVHFENIKGPANAKNIITISALRKNPNLVLLSSRRGPTKDGRIKPDLCTIGEDIESVSIENDLDFKTASGTSVATAIATRESAIISKRYKNITDIEIRADILKSILVNSAIDIWTQGPDFFSGFGRINTKAAIDTINTINTKAPLIFTDEIKYQQQHNINFNIDINSYLKITITWIDPAGNPASSKSLVNDIDIWIEDENKRKFYPYTLSKNINQKAMQNKSNNIDNIEQIEINNLQKGKYTLYINGKLIITHSQNFVLTSNLPIF